MEERTQTDREEEGEEERGGCGGREEGLDIGCRATTVCNDAHDNRCRWNRRKIVFNERFVTRGGRAVER